MNTNKLLILREELNNLQQAADYLQYSMDRTHTLLEQQNWSPEELERLESLASRFARLADMVTQRVMRLIDDLELTPDGSLLDRIHRAEKRGWVDQAGQLIQIRELRNLIAHEYAADKMADIYLAIVQLAPSLLAMVPKITAYTDNLVKRFVK
ncbi:MAG: hypothetical protein EPN21_00965 [Methylococcaceae bacterium]|nr:MAG: hypothetical protein EPN21_00965 [Methylococcaceae bacterium]